jgi:biopolymer transport protein ExbD
MAFKMPPKGTDDAELDVTAFMNLMIVLVPVLLLSMTFANISVLDLKLPELTGGSYASIASQSTLEVVVDDQGIRVYFPENTLIKAMPPTLNTAGETRHDFATLSAVMQALKKEMIDKKDIVIRLDKNTSYQNIVQTMDTVKSYKTVVVSSLVEYELFPEISLGDAS